MMILGNFKPYLLGALLAALAAPALAGAQGAAAVTEPRPATSADAAGGRPRHARQVDLPFLLESGLPERQPRAHAPQESAGPHPFREVLFQRAALTGAEPGAEAPRHPHLSLNPAFS